MKSKHEQQYVEYVRHRIPWLRRLGYLLCQDWHRADDLVQTTITQLYVHWKRIHRIGNLDGYARTTLVRTFLSEKRRAWSSRVDLVPEITDSGLPHERSTEHCVDRLTVRQALATVPPRQRATLVLRFYCDLDIEQTAAVLGCSTGTVKSQTSRGLDALRRALQESSAPVATH
ncbi:MAG TPA: SigE family RNA polymerase sigma factor [Pseudonocardiaceae bacterium]